MDSGWNLYRPFDKFSQEPEPVSKTMTETRAINEGMEEKKG
jgi:hypothetical protein